MLSLTDLTTLRPDIPVIKAFRDELYDRLASDDISTQHSFDYRDIEQSSERLTTRNMLGEKIIENENQAQQIAGMGGQVTDLQHALATKTAEVDSLTAELEALKLQFGILTQIADSKEWAAGGAQRGRQN